MSNPVSPASPAPRDQTGRDLKPPQECGVLCQALPGHCRGPRNAAISTPRPHAALMSCPPCPQIFCTVSSFSRTRIQGGLQAVHGEHGSLKAKDGVDNLKDSYGILIIDTLEGIPPILGLQGIVLTVWRARAQHELRRNAPKAASARHVLTKIRCLRFLELM